MNRVVSVQKKNQIVEKKYPLFWTLFLFFINNNFPQKYICFFDPKKLNIIIEKQNKNIKYDLFSHLFFLLLNAKTKKIIIKIIIPKTFFYNPTPL